MTISAEHLFRWKRKLEKHDDEKEILQILSKLRKVSMTIKLLQETGIGKTVKSLKKKYPGTVATQSEALVTEWKKLLGHESSPTKGTAGDESKSQCNGYNNQNGSSSHSKPSKSSHRKTPTSTSASASTTKSDKNPKTANSASMEGFNSSTATFEDCLGFNDSLSVKKRKAPTTSKPSLPSPSKPSSSKEHKEKSLESSPPPKKRKSSAAETSSSSKKKSSSKLPSVPQELQKQPTSLAPLEKVDVLSTLPEIQLNYKPLPHPDQYPAPVQRRKNVLSQEEAVYFTTSKRDRTAVYSGRRHGQVGDVPSLVQYCTKYLIDNIEDLSETGGVPYSLLKPVLERCTATQLYTLEDCNPYLLEDTDYLWEIHCKRDFRNAAPDEHETWRELYLRSFEEREAKLKAISANISANNQARAAPVRKTKVAYVEGTVKPPREVARKQAKHGTAHSSSAHSSSAPSKVCRPSTSDHTPSIPASSSSSTALKKPKTAPLMQKTLRLMKNLRR